MMNKVGTNKGMIAIGGQECWYIRIDAPLQIKGEDTYPGTGRSCHVDDLERRCVSTGKIN
jgi:hypothetical protein